MPFEISPKFVEAPAKVGEFQSVADAILRGCAMVEPTLNGQAIRESRGQITQACVWGAYVVGLCGTTDAVTFDYTDTPCFRAVMKPYEERYGATPVRDYTSGVFTREEIAARIAAL